MNSSILPLGTKVTTASGMNGIIEDVVYIIKREVAIEPSAGLYNTPGRQYELGALTDKQVRLVETITYNNTHPMKITVRATGGNRRATKRARKNRRRSRSN